MKTVAQLLKLKDQKNQEVHQIKPDHMVLEALMKMAEKNVGALLVVENDEVLGIISERDYARKLVLHGRSSVGTPVRDIMVSPVITVDTHQTVDTCLGIMSDRRLRHLPVVENGKLIGLLSIGDLVKEAIAEQAHSYNWNCGVIQAGQCRAKTGANVGCRSIRSSQAEKPGRALRKCSRVPAHREITAANTSSAPGVSSPRYNSPEN